MNKLFKQSITRANTNVLKVLTTQTSIELILVLAFIVEIVALGGICSYVDGIGLGTPMTLMFVFFPGLLVIVFQVWYATVLMTEYQELKKEQDNGNETN